MTIAAVRRKGLIWQLIISVDNSLQPRNCNRIVDYLGWGGEIHGGYGIVCVMLNAQNWREEE